MRRLALSLLALSALTGFDWPGRARTLASQMTDASPERRREILLEAASASDPEARALVVRALADDALAVRLEAAALAERLRLAEAMTPLVAWLGDARVELRLAAARALASLPSDASLPSLVRALGDADVGVRLAAVRAVAAAGAPGVVPLLDRVSDADSAVRVEAVRALGALGDVRAVLTLLGALQDPIPEVRQVAATALGALGDGRARAGLVALFHDPLYDVRSAAVRAAGELGAAAPEVVVDLASVALRADREGEPAAQGRLAVLAVQALARVGSEAACDVLVEVIRRGAERVDREPARAAFRALATMGASARARVATLATVTPPELDDALVDLVGEVGGDDAARVLLERLDRPDLTPSARGRLLLELGRTRARRAAVPLLVAASRELPRDATSPDRACPRPRIDAPALGGLVGLSATDDGLGPDALDPLVALYERARGGCERQVTVLLALVGRTGNPRARTTLAAALRAPSPAVRVVAATGLSRAGVAGVEADVVRALADASAEVRLAASDALSLHGDGAAVTALVAAWRADAPVDRVGLARALGRASSRADEASRRAAEEALAPCVRERAPELAAACLDALADAAGAGSATALAALDAAVDGPRRSLGHAALEALGNAAVRATGAARDGALEALTRRGAEADRRRRAAVAWGLRAGDARHVAWLTEALRGGDVDVATNAAAALGAMASRGVTDASATEALCAVASTARGPALAGNALRALAAVPGAPCAAAVATERLARGGEHVRRAAAALAWSAGEGARTALARCARTATEPGVAAACRARGEAPGPATGSVDARLVDDDGEALSATDYAMRLPGEMVRIGTTGPGAWVHVRGVAAGSFSVASPGELGE